MPLSEQFKQRYGIPGWALRVALGGWGDRIILGFLFGKLSDVTPEQFSQAADKGSPLIQGVSDQDWQEWAELARMAHVEKVTFDQLLDMCGKKRPDLLEVLVTNSNARPWLVNQLAEIKVKLGIYQDVSTRWQKSR